ncbi:hypothetical protein N0V82_010535 [Gnomoniopsis sp. IMI 355080]|nr:hypothetical protein N0V82_010535 [Gnomoniopsis sp. IMI 355080]
MAPVLRVVRFALAHDKSSHVLVAVSSSHGDSSKPLDLELLATDDQKAYVMTLSHARIARYKHAKNPCAESEWESALEALLLLDQPIGNVTATARIADDEGKPTGDDSSYMFIDVRRGVSRDTEVLGTLKLRKSHKAEAAVELFDWCSASIRARDKLEEDIVELRRENESLKALVAEETAKFQELVRTKQEFEATHDSWLKDLLNEKKVKIRMQEQILATAHVDPNKLASGTAAATASKPHLTGVGASRKGKRKAQGSDSVDGEQNSEDKADKMDLDIDSRPESHDEGPEEVDIATTDSETASDSESNPEPKSAARNKGTSASPALATGSPGKADNAGHNLRNKKVVTPDDSEDEAPPRKESPPRKRTSVPAYDPDDESTASE